MSGTEIILILFSNGVVLVTKIRRNDKRPTTICFDPLLLIQNISKRTEFSIKIQ